MPTRRRSELTIVLGLTAGLLASAFFWLAASPRAEASAQAQTQTSPCSLDIEEKAWPAFLLRGESSRLDITLRPNCPDGRQPLNLVLVFDTSSGMQGAPIERIEEMAAQFIEALDLPNHPTTRIGIVAYDSLGINDCRLTNDEAAVLACIDRLSNNQRYGDRSQPDRGFDEALRILSRGRSLGEAGFVSEAVVLFSGSVGKSAGSWLYSALEAKRRGLHISTVCIGDGCEPSLPAVASGPKHAHLAANIGQIAAIFDKIRLYLTTLALGETSLVVQIPEDVELISNSVLPPGQISADQKTFRWQLAALSRDGNSVSLGLRPSRLGFQSLTRSVVADYLGFELRAGSATGPGAWVQVFGPIVQPRPW